MASTSCFFKLEEQLTCPGCLNLFTNPKTLPCLHSFCQVCLEGLPLDKINETYCFSCPTCHHCVVLPEAGARAFPVAFHIKNLNEIHNLMKKVADNEHVICDNCTVANSNGYCNDCNKFLCTECDLVHKKWGPTSNHQLTSLDEVISSSQMFTFKQEPPTPCSVTSHDEPLKYFCETCDETICRDCAILAHKDHAYNLMADSYTKHYQELEHLLVPVKEKIATVKNMLSILTEREIDIGERGERVLEEIHEMVEEMIGDLRQSERKLTDQAKRVTNAKLKVLSQQKQSSQLSLERLEDVKNYVEQSLKTGTSPQILSSKEQMKKHMSEITTLINAEDLLPKVEADIVLSKNVKSLQHIGDIFSGSALQQCRVKKIDCFEHLPKERKVSFSLIMEAPDSSLLSVPHSSLRCSLVPVDGNVNEPIDATVIATSTHSGVYKILCNPSSHDTHRVKIQVYDVQLEGTSLVIPFNPYLDNINPVHTISELHYPWRVAVSDDGYLIVSESLGDRVTIMDREGTKVKSFGGKEGCGNVKFLSPHGVAFTSDKFILVSDSHRIQKINIDGDCLASVGEEGSEPLQFKYPVGIAISPLTGHIYVADSGNHRIQVLNSDLTFSHFFGSKGSANGQFLYPRDIAIDNRGLVYVTDWVNHRIQYFTPDGKFIAHFGNEGSGPGQLNSPIGITIDNAATGLVYVSEWNNHRISVFTNEGLFVSSFGREGSNIEEFNSPKGLTFDKEGFLYICDYYNNRLVVY